VHQVRLTACPQCMLPHHASNGLSDRRGGIAPSTGSSIGSFIQPDLAECIAAQRVLFQRAPPRRRRWRCFFEEEFLRIAHRVSVSKKVLGPYFRKDRL